MPEDGERIVQSILTPLDDATAEFRFASTEVDAADGWRTHMVGMARKEAWEQRDASAALGQLKLRCAAPISAKRYYETLHDVGLQYGSSFRAIEALWRGRDEVLTRVRLPPHLAVEAAQALHPALLDACLHVYPALIADYGNFDRPPPELRHTYLPIGIERFRCSGPGAREVWVHAVRRPAQDDPQRVTIDIAVYREDGSQAATLEGLSLKQLPPEALIPNAAQGRPDWLYQLQWVERPQLQEASADQPAGEPHGWLILADQAGVGAALAHMLTGRALLEPRRSSDALRGAARRVHATIRSPARSHQSLVARYNERPHDARRIPKIAEDREWERACTVSGDGRSAVPAARGSSHLAGVTQCDLGPA